VNLSSAAAATAIVVAVGTAAGSLYRGWRNRIRDAAAKPFQTGQAAVNEAEIALRMKDRRLDDAAARETDLLGQLEQAKAANSAQQGQIRELYVNIGELQSENARLERESHAARERIGELEAAMKDLKAKLGINGGSP
jgi:chromosome segregation ATPase